MEDKILDILKTKGGQKARDIAATLSFDKQDCKIILQKMKKCHLIWQDSSYNWHLGNEKITGKTKSIEKDTLLSKICSYYLQCISLDDESGVSLFARPGVSSDYVELSTFPDLISESPPILTSDGVSQLFNRLRNTPSRITPVVGYPVRLRFHEAKSGWKGFKVEPVLLFEFVADALQTTTTPQLSFDYPLLNTQVIRNFAAGNSSFIMDEVALLSETLGIGNPDGIELDELVSRLCEIRNDWDWAETIDPYKLSNSKKLQFIEKEGIYNRAVVFGMEKSLYTKGLEQELVKLRDISESEYSATALGQWLSKSLSHQEMSSFSHQILEPLPLNSEQNEAVQRSLTQSLTIVTGPPGTGKSQVVSSILVNAAKAGKKVLFASKNNKAVDVVETRVNALGPRPVVLRLGRGEYQATLATYLTSLLASKTTPEDQLKLNESENEYTKILSEIRTLHVEATRTIELRNQTDDCEKKAEPIREELGAELFAFFRTLEPTVFEVTEKQIRTATNKATRKCQPIPTRLLWPLLRSKRFATLYNIAQGYQNQIENLCLTFPKQPTIDDDIKDWEALCRTIKNRLQLLNVVKEYHSTLVSLQAAPRLEDIYIHLNNALTKQSTQALDVWFSWLQTAPSRLNQSQRHLLGEFASILRLIAQSDVQKQRAGRELFSKYRQLFPSLVNFLPCWAVTSLSAHGRIPLEPGFFDILVIDEASQCDIASVVPLLFRAKSAVIIGDPQQLRHISSISPRRDCVLLEQNGMTDGLLNWAYSENSLYDLASPLANSDDIVMLRDHHRSHAQIIGFSNMYFYEERLRIATNYTNLRSPFKQKGPAVRWIPVKGKVVKPGSGALNEIEAQHVVKELERLAIEQGYNGTVGVVTPFRAQANRIRVLVLAHKDGQRIVTCLDLLIDTVHRFQGDEKDVIFFSPVISQGMPVTASGFLKSTANLFNVAITRARAALIIVGDIEASANSNIDHLSKFTEYVSSLSEMQSETPEPFTRDFGLKYPSVTNPERVSDWERLFYEALYNNGIKTLPQYDVEKYTLDFALFSGARKLNIEIDGERYHRSWNGELLYHDQLRNRRLIELGWDVMRFWVYEIRDDIDRCIQMVKNWG